MSTPTTATHTLAEIIDRETAAPDLLAALREATELLEHYGKFAVIEMDDGEPVRCSPGSTVIRARAAIAKATGKS